MITFAVCTCGRAFDPSAWSSLTSVARLVHHGEEWKRRRCDCGNELEVRLHEDDVAQELVNARARMHAFYRHAHLELLGMAVCKPESREKHLLQARGHREAARGERDRALQLEGLLLGIWKAREVRSRMQRVGRNLQVVMGGRAEKKAAP